MDIREFLIDKPLAFLKRQRLLRDRFMVWFLLLAVLSCLAVLGLLALRLSPSDFVVPLEYTSGIGLSNLGSWYRIYSYGLFSLVVSIFNVTLAVISFEKSRINSFFLLLGAIVVNIFTLVVVYNLLNQIS